MEFDFDDSMFQENHRIPRTAKLTSYNAKICCPMWFEGEGCDTEEGLMSQLKFSADYHFMKQHYDTAAQKYQSLLELSQDSGLFMRRDVMESLARCYMKLHRPQDALQLVQKMEDMKAHDDHEVQCLSLMLQVCCQMGHMAAKIKVLQKLISFHCHHAPYWMQLAEVYSMLGGTTSGGCDRSGCKALSGVTNIPLHQIVFTCYIRARLLLQVNHRNSGSFIKDQQLTSLQKVTMAVEELDMSASQITAAEQFLSRDLHVGHPSSDDEILPQAKSTTKVLYREKATFEERWFSWVREGNVEPEEDPTGHSVRWI